MYECDNFSPKYVYILTFGTLYYERSEMYFIIEKARPPHTHSFLTTFIKVDYVVSSI